MGPQGQPGANGVSGLTTASASASVSAASVGTAEAVCPSGKVAIAGGFRFETGNSTFAPFTFERSSGGNGWVLVAFNANNLTRTMTVTATCVAAL
ncbi:MAG: hypothetical protein KY464_09945 [Gemmatimonadetes bacterium]|nr:hypothetical protein [Gemmatimonadota bacterium]